MLRLAGRQNSVMIDAATPSPQPTTKKLTLDDLMPVKAPVDTTVGTLFVRHAHRSDWKHFESDDPVELGKAALRRLCSRVEEKSVSDPLADTDLDALTAADIDSLAPVIAKRSDWTELTLEPGLQGLGRLVKEARVRERDSHTQWVEKLRQSVGSGYPFLSDETLEKLKQQVAGVADIRSNLAALGILNEVKRSAGAADARAALAATLLDGSRDRVLLQRPEDTPIGRAAIESAKHSREVAQKMDGLVDLVGGLNQTLITEVLPAWIRQVAENQGHAQVSLEKAEVSLRWAKWALIASVATSVLSIFIAAVLTWWQIGVARSIDADSSAQQKRTEKLLRDQLAVQRQLTNQQARDANQLRGLLQQESMEAAESRKLFRELQQAPASKK